MPEIVPSSPAAAPKTVRPRVVTFMSILLLILGLMLIAFIIGIFVTAPEALEQTIRKLLQEDNKAIDPAVLSAGVQQIRIFSLFLLPNALLHLAAGIGLWRMRKWGMYCFFVLFAWSALSFARGGYSLWVAWVVVLLEGAGAAYLYTNKTSLR
ncbi:MAG: hypothetical protein AAB384_00370 [Patescibacteria group bacterium]